MDGILQLKKGKAGLVTEEMDKDFGCAMASLCLFDFIVNLVFLHYILPEGTILGEILSISLALNIGDLLHVSAVVQSLGLCI